MRGANGLNNSSAGRERRHVPSVNFYQRVPTDLTEATSLGAFMSICCILVMIILFFSETFAFVSSNITTSLSVDDKSETPQIRLNFDLSFYALPCDYLSVDVLDSLGANRQNITKNVEKWHLDEEGARKGFHGRNREQREIKHDEHPEEVLRDYGDAPGDHPMDLDTDYQDHLNKNAMVFVNFYAPWCIWCQRLHPTWDNLAKMMKNSEYNVIIATLDCVKHKDLCAKERVRAFPTLRWYESGREVSPDYRGDRTVQALSDFVKLKAKNMQRIKQNPRIQEQRQRMRFKTEEGCKVTGHIMVNRVPGNFHIQARSINHNLNIAMTNLSHSVNHLSFGEDSSKETSKLKRILKQVPSIHKQFKPLDGQTYSTFQFHRAFHHNLKVISTYFDMGGGSFNELSTYQVLAQSQIMEFDEMSVPEARFSYDISPLSVVVKKTGRKWYDYLTSLCAIIGGTFTTLGLVDGALYKVFKSKKL